MKKILLAMIACTFLGGTSFAYQTKYYKLKVASQSDGYIGTKTTLPLTAYLTVDTDGGAYLVWYWTQNGQKYCSEPIWFGNDTYGYSDDLHYSDSWFIQNLSENIYQWGYIEMAGSGSVSGALPGSYKGRCATGVYNWNDDEDLGFGYTGIVSASVYATDSDYDAESAAWDLAYYLQFKGYTIPAYDGISYWD